MMPRKASIVANMRLDLSKLRHGSVDRKSIGRSSGLGSQTIRGSVEDYIKGNGTSVLTNTDPPNYQTALGKYMQEQTLKTNKDLGLTPRKELDRSPKPETIHR